MQNTNHGSFGVSGPYWWPSLKPNSFLQFFDSETQYTLLDSNIAHRIQKEMALTFFDLTIKQDKTKVDVFRNNPWQQHGASMTLKGM